MKRAAVVAIALALAASAAAATAAEDPMTAPPPAGYYLYQKVVYQNDGGLPDDQTYFAHLLRSIGAHLTATDGRVEIRVVSFGPGVKALQGARGNPALAQTIDALRAKGVRFLVCRNTMRGMGLKVEDLYGVGPEDVVPSGVAEIARLQGLGFVYIHP